MEHGGAGRRRALGRLLLLVGLAVLALLVVQPSSPVAPAAPPLRLASATDPAPPTGVTIDPGNGQFRSVSWTASADNTLITGYKVYLDGRLVADVPKSRTSTSSAITGLTNGTDYTVRVVSYSAVATGTTAGTATSWPRDGSAPTYPRRVAVAVRDGGMRVTWAANTEADLAGYRVLRDGVVVSGTVTGTSFIDSGLVNGQRYKYNVQAVDVSRQWSSSSSSVYGRPVDSAPPAPTGLAATAGDTRVDLVWEANEEWDVDTYRVLRDGIVVATVPEPEYVDTAVANDRTYEYAVQAVDTSGKVSPASSAVRATPTDTTAPAVVTGLAATRGDTRVTVSWTAGPEGDIASYRVLRDGSEVASVGAGATSWVDTGVVNDTRYGYTVRAVDTHGNASAAQATVYATPTDLTPPGAPIRFLAERGDRQVTLSWAAGTGSDVAGYRVLRDGVEVAVVAAGATSYTDTGLVNDRSYRYEVVAVDGHGNRSDPTPSSRATPTDLTPPAAPTGLTAARGDTRVDLTWTAGTDADLVGYRVLRDGAVVATVTGTSWTDTGLINDTTYAYRLVAVDGHGNLSPQSAETRSTPTDLAPPAVPTGFAAVRGDRRVDLTWTANAEPDLDGYRLYRDDVLVASPTGTSYADTGLVVDRAYAYRLVAVDTHGNPSPSTAAVSATPTDLTPPAVPTAPAATRGDGSVTLSWTPVRDADLAGYVVQRDGVDVATVTTTSTVDTGLTNDTAYTYTVVAVDTHGNRSAASTPVTATPTDLTAPPAPTGLRAQGLDSVIRLDWDPSPAGDRDWYLVYRDGVHVGWVDAQAGTTWFEDAVANDVDHVYAVAARDTHSNDSPFSSAVTARATDLTAPAAPAGFAAVRGDGRVDLSWTANGEPDLASYRVLRDGVEIATLTGASSYADTAVVNDRTYAYALVAVDTHANRSAAASASATPTDLTAPAAPSAPAATAGERQVALTWTAPADADVVGYRVLRSGAAVATATGTTATVTGLTPGAAVDLVVVAVDGHGNVSTASATVTATPYDHTAPAAPTALTGQPGTGSATIGWTTPADPDVLAFRVLRDGVQVATANVSPVTVTGLTDGTSYSFTVVAVDPTGNASPVSAAVVVTPRSAVPAQGSGQGGGLAVSGDGRYVVVATTARLEPTDTNSAPELYRIDRVAGTASRIAPLAASATTADPTNAAAPAVSDDGRYVALATTAKLAAADTNGLSDVYRLDTVTGTWSLVSVPAGGRVSPSVPGTELQTGAAVHATSPSVVMSADGDLVLFYSARSDLGPADTNGVVDVYAKRMSTGAVTRVSAAAGGRDLSRAATGPALALTPDGRYALFPATGPNGPMVLLRAALSGPDAGQVVVVSTMTVGARTSEVGVYRDAGDVDVSDDGRYVAFVTSARPTSPGQTFTTGLAYRVDTATGTVQPLGDGQTTAWEHQVALDPTGRYGFFSTTAALTPGDTDGHTDVHRRDLDTGVLTLVTAGASGQQVSGPTGSVGAAEYGRVVAVSGDLVVLATSEALLPADTNRVRDVYAKDLATGAVRSVVA